VGRNNNLFNQFLLQNYLFYRCFDFAVINNNNIDLFYVTLTVLNILYSNNLI